jgi:hypothetical protein
VSVITQAVCCGESLEEFLAKGWHYYAP